MIGGSKAVKCNYGILIIPFVLFYHGFPQYAMIDIRLCSTDYYALQVVRLRNGRTRGIIGFDNIRILELCDIKVDSVSYPVHEMARNAVEMIIHGSRDCVFVSHTIVKRGSIG